MPGPIEATTDLVSAPGKLVESLVKVGAHKLDYELGRALKRTKIGRDAIEGVEQAHGLFKKGQKRAGDFIEAQINKRLHPSEADIIPATIKQEQAEPASVKSVASANIQPGELVEAIRQALAPVATKGTTKSGTEYYSAFQSNRTTRRRYPKRVSTGRRPVSKKPWQGQGGARARRTGGRTRGYGRYRNTYGRSTYGTGRRSRRYWNRHY